MMRLVYSCLLRPVPGECPANRGVGGFPGPPPPPVSLTDYWPVHQCMSRGQGGGPPDSQLLLSSDDGDLAAALIE
jgi:hypothetical protein